MEYRSTGGFYIVEAIIALGLLTVGFLAMLTLLAKSVSLNRVISDSYVGNYLALEGVELVKNTVDANIAYMQNLNNKQCTWNSGFETAGVYELDWRGARPDINDPQRDCPGKALAQWEFLGDPLRLEQVTDSRGNITYRYGYSNGAVTPFVRRIEVAPGDPGELKVNSIVTWTTRGGGNFTVNVEDRLYNWQRR